MLDVRLRPVRGRVRLVLLRPSAAPMKLDPGMRRRRMADAQAKLTRAEELEAQAKVLRVAAERTAHVWQFEIRNGMVIDPCDAEH